MPGTMKKRPHEAGRVVVQATEDPDPRWVERRSRSTRRNGQAMQAKQFLCRRKTKRPRTMWGQLSLI
jgi:hypothetical protein